MSTATFANDVSSARGAFAFHYAPSLPEEGIAWYSQFNVLVTHDPLPADQVARLHARGTKLLLYEWSVAFYETRATAWQQSLLRKHPNVLLNRVALTGGAGSDTAPAWYFDPATTEHQYERAADLARRIEDAGYDGVFLDTTTIESVHADARREYEARHPDIPYDAAFSRFLLQFRSRLGQNGIIFTNQGYRSPQYYLPYVDFDLTESLITWPKHGAFKLRPWNDNADPWNSVLFLMRTVIEPLSRQYPSVRFSHLNYIDSADRDAIHVAVAIARIFETDAYAAAPSIDDEVDPVYLYDFGKPLGGRVDLDDDNVTYREFERGVIAISAARHDMILNTTPSGLTLTLPATSGEPRAFFFNIER